MRTRMKRLTSLFLALVMVFTLIPPVALAAGVNESLVSTLAALYDGDEARAREELEALYEAGIIDEDGNLVALDVREDGVSVELDALAQRIMSGETVGALTVNGNDATPKQILQIQQVKSLLEVIRLLDEDVEITDEHVANLQALLEGIADGDIDMDEAVRRGKLSLSARSSLLTGDPAEPEDLPETKTGYGTVDVDEDGKYTAPMIDGDTYTKNYSFTLTDLTNNIYYTDSQYEGLGLDGVVTLSCADTATAGGTVTVTATLDKAQSVPVSFDYAAAGGGIGATGNGTVTWAAGESGDKTFDVTVDAKGNENWQGSRAFVINAGNIKNATFADNKTVWSKTVTVEASDTGKIMISYPWIERTVDGSTFTRKGSGTEVNVYAIFDDLNGGGLQLTFNYYLATKNTSNVEYNSYVRYIISDGVYDDVHNSGRFIRSTKTEGTYTDTVTVYGPITGKNTINLGFRCMGHGAASKSTLNSVTIKVRSPQTKATIESVSVPAGTYYSGQVVPVTITLNQYAVMSDTNKLTVNGVDCPLLDASGTESKKFTFGYTVKDVDTGSLNVTGLTGTIYNASDKAVTIDGSFPQTTFDTNTDVKVTLVSDVKGNSLDLTNIRYGIDDGDAGEQVVTVVLPFTSGASVEWVGSEGVDCTTNGNGFSMSLPTYGAATIKGYLAGAYFSYDNGTTRYPVYVVRSTDGTETPVALAARFATPINESAYLRKDTVDLFMDMEILTPDDATKYLPAYSEMETDAKGCAYADGETEAAPAFVGSNWSYYVKGGVFFETKDAGTEEHQTYIARPDTGDTAAAEDQDGVMEGFLKRADGKYVVLQDAENPNNQYDVEIVVDQAFYDVMTDSMRAESPKDITLSYQCSNRRNFTFIKPKDFEWVCYKVQADGTLKEDTTSFKLVLDDSTPADGTTPGVWHVVPTGTGDGRFVFWLKVKNGSSAKSYNLYMVQDKDKNPAFGQPITVLEGKDPFLMIPEFSQVRTTLTGENTDILFASNVVKRNTYAGKSTTFTAKLYAAEPDGSGYKKKNETILKEGAVTSTGEEQVNRYTIPGEWLNEAGIYAVDLTTAYEGGTTQGDMADVSGSVTKPVSLGPVTAYLIVKQAPVKVKLNPLKSYSVTSKNIPESLGYSLTSATDGVEVEYTIQKSGEALGERKTASDGSIPFSAGTPAALKESYTVTVYARNSAEEPWSVDSMLLTVYNDDILDILVRDVIAGEIGGTTGGKVSDETAGAKDSIVAMDNHSKVEKYPKVEGKDYQLSFEEFTTLRTDMSLQKIISANYGAGVWGLLSDKMQWESSDPATVSVDYKQGGIYSDIRNYSYVSYAPATDFLLVGKGDTAEGKTVKVTATHAATGMSASIDVTAKTLTDQLYVFQFNPQVTTTVTYTTADEKGAEVRRELTSNEKGELAVYEPYGIQGAVMAKSEKDGDTYVGTLYPSELVSGERDIASLQLYPCNNLRLRAIANAALTFLNQNGQAYSGPVTLRAGVYKNGVYCPEAKVKTEKGASSGQNGREDINATASNGKLNLWFDPMQFNINDQETGGLQPGDTVTYVIEYRVAGYQPGYVILNAYSNLEGAARPTDSVIQLRNLKGGDNVPQITLQTLQQYYDDTPTSYTRDVIDYTENIGISNRFNKAELYTDVALLGETVSRDDNGYTTYAGDDVTSFALCTTSGKELTGQTGGSETKAQQIVKLEDLTKDTKLYVFPFSSTAMARSVYTMTDENMSSDGITDQGSDATHSARVMMRFTRGDKTIKDESLPFGVSNLSHQEDLGKADGASEKLGQQIKNDVQSKVDIGAIFKQINVNDLIRKGFVFLQQMSGAAGDNMLNMMILPTEDPATFRIMVFVGYNERKEENTASSGNLSVNYDPEQIYDDAQKFEKALEDMAKDDSDDDDDDSSGEGSLKFNFYGTLLLDARLGIADGNWDISFIGGNVGTNFKAGYEWSQTFMCGPVPALISFEVGFAADLEVAFCERSDAKAMLLDVAASISLEAFAGLGFDLSLVAFKLGIFGKIGADVNFLYLLPENETGTKLDIDGEIGLKMEAKILFVSYEKTFASTGFGWTKQWGRYEDIQTAWEKGEPLEITGVTASGRAYSMRLFANGAALVEIDGGGEIENRDYLELADRAWNGGAGSTGRRMLLKAATPLTGALNDVQTNAYPYSNPVLTDDGSMFLYISDNDNAEEVQSVVSYAVNNGSGYTNKGALYDIKGNNAILADSDVVASGTGSNIFAAWVKQQETPTMELLGKTMGDAATYDDLGMMMNATEIYAAKYNGNAWTTQRLTTNSVADMSPTVASNADGKAIVAWRSLSATNMPKEESALAEGEKQQDISTMFNAENNINYRIWNGEGWTEAQVAYNGNAGTVNAIDSAMLSNGTSILVYTVRTGEDITTTETFYTVIDNTGAVVTTGRLTNDSSTDTNAQVMAVGNQFVVGWYSEYSAGDTASATEATVAHDIGLARINANGSVDATFPESIGGEAGSGITSDFRFSAPAGIAGINQLSIVWSEKNAEDQYELNAVRFFQTEDSEDIIITSPTDIAKTENNCVVDRFDTYTDAEGKVYTLILCSDYSDIEGLSVYDTINLESGLQVLTGNNSKDPASSTLTVLEQNPVAHMKLGSGTFPETAIEVTADTNLYELVPGLNLPVQFTVKNTGASTVNSVTVQLGTASKTVEALALLPDQSTIITAVYPVPENKVEDVAYTVTADKTTEGGTLVLNRPDVGISGMKLLREADGERDVQVTLCNSSGIPLAGSGKSVKLAFYKDSGYTQQVGDTVDILSDADADIDEGVYTYLQTLYVSDFIDSDAKEIPDSGIRVYARAWVEDVEELYTTNNEAMLFFQGLLTKYGQMTVDTFLVENDGQYTVNADIRNNSIQAYTGIPTATLLDSNGEEITRKVFRDNLPLRLSAEQSKVLSTNFASTDIGEGKLPAQVQISVTPTEAFNAYAPTAKANLTYNGKDQTLVNAGCVSDGRLQYALGSDAETEPTSGWSDSIPTGRESGTYYVWYKVVDNVDFAEIPQGCVTVSIAKAKNLKPVLSETKIVTTENSIQINGFYNASPLTEAKYQYSLDGGKTWLPEDDGTTNTICRFDNDDNDDNDNLIGGTTYKVNVTPGTTYQLRVRTVETEHTEGVETSDILSVTTPAKKVDLTGVSITGTAQVGNTLTAAVTGKDGVPTGVTYQWYRGDAVIDGATYSTYALTKNDYGQQIKVVATQSGIAKTSEAVSVDQAPAVAVANSSIRATATNTSITVTAPRSTATRNYQYSLDNATWQTDNVFTFESASDNTQKTVYVRTGGADWQKTGTEVGQATVSVPGKPYPFDAAPTVVAKSFEYQGYTNEKAPTLSIELKAGAETPTFQYRVGTAGTWQSWTLEAANNLSVGNRYYMRAVINGNTNYHAYTTEPVTFAVTKSTTDARLAPAAPAVSDNSLIVTVAEADRGKALEYQVDGTADDKWVSVPVLNKDGQFTLGALSAGSHKVNLRYRADSNYAKPSNSVVSALFNLTQYSVAYDANGGSNAPAPQTATSPATITVYAKTDKAHTPTRSGYTFAGWYDDKDEGSEVTETLSESKTLYAHWTANTYTIAFNANGGKGTMTSISNIAYDAAQTLTTNAFSNGTDTFVGWATSANGPVIYTDKQNVKNLTTGTGTVTLYAVWVDSGKKVDGAVISDYPGSVELKLMRGNTQVGGTQVVTLTLQASGDDAGKYTGTYSFTGVPNGSYNLVAMQVVAKAGEAGDYEEALTRTAAVTVSGSGDESKVSFGTDDTGRIVMPSGDTSSLVEVKEDTPPVIVGGLDTVAEDQKVEDRSVNVTMSVESQDKTTTDEGTKDAIDAIENLEIGETEELSYLNIGIEKEVVKDGVSESKEAITETSSVVTITIPYDMTDKEAYQITFYRHHVDAQGNASTMALTRDSAPSNADGHFYVNKAGNMIYLYTKLFSTYAIGYNPDATDSGSGNNGNNGGSGAAGGGTTYAPTISNPSNGTVSINPTSPKAGDKVTITAKPDEGYEVDTVSVTDANGKSVSMTKVSDTTYTYTQPANKVTIDVTFKAASTSDTLAVFSDVNASDWYADAVRWAVDNGVMNGWANPLDAGMLFGPNDTTTRAMVATMLWRLEGSPVVSGEMKFVDVAKGTWYTEAVRWASGAGIITGSKIPAETTPWPMGFRPDDAVTREQLAAMLYRYAQYKKADVSASASLSSYGDAQTVSGWATSAMQWAVSSGIINGIDSNLVPAGKATRAQVATMLMRYSTEK